MSRSMHALQGELLPYNHHLHQFLTFLKHERGFADTTIVNRKRSLKPFLAWVIAQDVQLSAVTLVTITKYSPALLPAGGSELACHSMCSLCKAALLSGATFFPN